MNISTWLDRKTAEKIDVSHIELPADISYDNDPDERLFLKSISLVDIFVPEIIPLPRSNDMDAGITAEVKTKSRHSFIRNEMASVY